MDSETQQLYNSVMDIAGKIDCHLAKEQGEHESVRDMLRIDLRDFLIFLITADRIIAKDEMRYINRSLNYNFSEETLKDYVAKSNILSDDYLNSPPPSMKYFLQYGKDEFIVQESQYYDISKLYLLIFQMLGEDFLSACRHIDVKEINQLTRYRFMLESNIKAFSKNGGKAPHRPDSIPFKRKQKIESDDTSVISDAPAFIGTISGGEATSDDLNALLDQLDSLIGLQSVKTDVKNLINLLKVIELRKKNGLKAPSVTRHFVFTGNPGTGKTTVARLLSQIYCSLGILSKGHLVEVDRSGLVAAYMGQTAIKVQDVINRSLGGVLFIDEAYSLANKTQGGDFGQEAIDTLVKAMEDHRDDLIVIVAGYPDRMEQFIDSNPGLKSRFQKVITFPDYTAEELLTIFKHLCSENDYRLSEDAEQYLFTQLTDYTAHKSDNFGNARDIRNFLDSAISSQANRLLTSNVTDTSALMTLLPADLYPIFKEESI